MKRKILNIKRKVSSYKHALYAINGANINTAIILPG
jgi:hypothetical protein